MNTNLDDPIYPYSSGVSVQIAKNIDGNEFTRQLSLSLAFYCMIQKLGMEAVKVTELNYPFYKTYGMTMAGLRAIGYDFDYDDFNSFVHGRLPYDVLLKPDHVLRGILQSPLVRKVVSVKYSTNISYRNYVMFWDDKFGAHGLSAESKFVSHILVEY
ncbi:hypothetical protein GmHk_02G004450 [Glycine max]|nr:hypothetical protein GmHk_02G004450 [Glycine max]